MDSEFNIHRGPLPNNGEMVEMGGSLRFRYYKVRRNGILHFVKTPTEEYANDLLTIESLRKEFLLGYGLNHPGFVRYFSFEDNHLYEEYVEGKTLRQLIDIQDRRLYQKGFIESTCRQILEAIRYLHTQGILHLDLKPENIMVADIGDQVKIIDLSCSKSNSIDSTSGYTFGYVAPEQEGGMENLTTDIYQVGCVIKELTWATRKEGKWRHFISKSTANHPDNRFTNADEALEAIPVGRKNILKLYIPFIFIIITGGILSILFRQMTNNKEINKDVSEIITTEPKHQKENIDPPTQTVTLTIQPPEEKELQVERKLSKLINQKLEELYAVEVIPMYKKMLEDENYKNEVSYNQSFVNAYISALGLLQQFGDELKSRYPQYDNFIDESIKNAFETKTYKMREKLYPPSNKPAVWETEVVVGQTDSKE